MEALIKTVESYLKRKSTIGQLRTVLKQTKENEQMKKTTPRLSDGTAKFLETNFRSVNGGAEQVLSTIAMLADLPLVKTNTDPSQSIDYAIRAFSDVYRKELHGLRGKFSKDELMLVIDVFNGSLLSPQLAGQHIYANVADGIELDRLDEKWSIDKATMLPKIQEISNLQRACLELWAVAYWQGDFYLTQEPEEYVAPYAE